MLSINATALRATPHEPSAAPPAAADAAGFASLLRQAVPAAHATMPVAPPPAASAEAEPAPASADPDAQHPTEADDSAAPPTANDPANRTRALPKGKLRAADGPAARGAKPTTDAADAGTAPTTDKSAAASTPAQADATATAAIDPTIMHWLAGQQQRTVDDATRRPAGGHGDGTDTAADPAALGGTGTDTRAAAHAARVAEAKADAKLQDRAAQTTLDAAAAAGADKLASALAAPQGGASAAPPPTGATPGLQDIAAGAALAAAPPPAARADAAPVVVALATPVAAPDFAQTLGVQLSVLARDGVQQAELHLNPAEMGPVSVQIVMDGTQARVDFGADVAATRQAIEAGLPELASALRDAGFTLAGGGVSQHSGGRSSSGDAEASRDRGEQRSPVGDLAGRASAPVRRFVSAGGVDVFA